MRQLANASHVGDLNDIVQIARRRRDSYNPTNNNDADVFTKLKTDILPFVLQFLPLDDVHILMYGSCKLMHANVIISLHEMGRLEGFADCIFRSIMVSKMKADDSRRQREWDYFTFRGHVLPQEIHTHDPASWTVNPDANSREYIFLIYIRYVLDSHAEWYLTMTGVDPSTDLYIMISNLDLKVKDAIWRLHNRAAERHGAVGFDYHSDFSQIAQDISDVYRWHFETYLQVLIMDQADISDRMIVELQDMSDIV